MNDKIVICGLQFNKNDIKEYSIKNKNYIYRPVYKYDNKLKNKLKHNKYTFYKYEPYCDFNPNLNIENVLYKVITKDGSFQEEDAYVIKENTNDFKKCEIKPTESLSIITNKEYCFFGNGIDLENVENQYNRLDKFMNFDKLNTTEKISQKFNNKTDNLKYYINKFKRLSPNVKLIVGFVIFFLIISIITVLGMVSEDEYDNPPSTTISSTITTEKLSKINFKFNDKNRSIILNTGETTKDYYFICPENSIIDLNDIEFISDDDTLCIIKYDFIKDNEIHVTIAGIDEGNTTIYLKSKKDNIKSPLVYVSIIEAQTTEEIFEEKFTEHNELIVEETVETTKAENTTTESTTKPHGRVVYITPTGSKYHYSQNCAGKNAMERYIEDVENSYEPCKKCT